MSLSLADTVIKYDVNLGGLMTCFGLTPSPADYNGPPSRWPAAEPSVTVAQLFSFWEESLGLCGTASILEPRQRIHAVTVWEAEGMEPILSQLSRPIGKNHEDHRCQWEPECTSLFALLTIQNPG